MTLETVDLTEMRALVERMERLVGGDVTPLAAVNPDGTPGNVASGELIEAAWGNATSNSIGYLMGRHGVTAAGAPSVPTGATQQIAWSTVSAPSWGAGPLLTVPAGHTGLHVVSASVTGPAIQAGAFADIIINATGANYIGYIPSGKSVVSFAALAVLVPGNQIGVRCYNPTAAAAFFNTSLNVYRVTG